MSSAYTSLVASLSGTDVMLEVLVAAMVDTVGAFWASMSLSASAAMSSSLVYLVKSVMQERTLAGRRLSQRARSISMGLEGPAVVGGSRARARSSARAVEGR